MSDRWAGAVGDNTAPDLPSAQAATSVGSAPTALRPGEAWVEDADAGSDGRPEAPAPVVSPPPLAIDEGDDDAWAGAAPVAPPPPPAGWEPPTEVLSPVHPPVGAGEADAPPTAEHRAVGAVAADRPGASPGRRGVVGPLRQLVRRVDAWTVFKVSLLFYLLMLVVVLAAGIAGWQVAAGLGFIRNLEKLIRTLSDSRTYVLHPKAILEYAAAVGAVLALLGTVLNTVAALLYNLISDVVGGVQAVVVQEDDPDEGY